MEVGEVSLVLVAVDSVSPETLTVGAVTTTVLVAMTSDELV